MLDETLHRKSPYTSPVTGPAVRTAASPVVGPAVGSRRVRCYVQPMVWCAAQYTDVDAR